MGMRQEQGSEGPHETVGVATVLAGTAESGGRYALVELREAQGAGPPRHRHEFEDEMIYVLEGELTLYRGNERIQASPGSCVALPRGLDHTYRVNSASARLLVFLVPGGIEDSVGELDWNSRATDIEKLITIAATYGVEITGPPLEHRGGLQ